MTKMIKMSREMFGKIPIDFRKNSVGFIYAFDPADSEVIGSGSSKKIALAKAKRTLREKYSKRSK